MAQYKLAKEGPLASSLLEMSGFARVDENLKRCPEWRAEEEQRGHDPPGPQGQPHFEFDFLVCVGTCLSHRLVEANTSNSHACDPKHMLGLDKVRDSDEGMAEWLKGRVTSGYRKFVFSFFSFQPFLSHPRGRVVKKLILNVTDPCGSCRMGQTIEDGVVNGRLQVHGVRNLRVIDASVFPLIPDARIQYPVYMVAEKGADFIKQDRSALYQPNEGLVDRFKDLVL